jgi:DNA-binding helix-hairpin-helix protein with protein kinase domain
MLVACSNCSTHYSDSLTACPACGSENKPTYEQRLADAEDRLLAEIASGAVTDIAPSWLTSGSEIAPDEIDRLMTTAIETSERRSRDAGLKFIMRGVLFCLSPLLLILIPFGLLLIPIAILMGFASISIGLVKVVTGSPVGNDRT